MVTIPKNPLSLRKRIYNLRLPFLKKSIFENPKILMKIIQTKAKIKDGKLKLPKYLDFNSEEVDVIIIAKQELDEDEKKRQKMIEAGYNTREKILELIQKVKLEMLQERNNPNAFVNKYLD